MAPGMTILGGLFIILAETVLLRVFGVRVLIPQLVVFLTVYVAFRRSLNLGVVATLFYAGLADLCSGGPRGYVALGLTVVFFVSVAAGTQWKPKTWLTISLASAPAVILCDISTLVTLAVFQGATRPLKHLLTTTPVVAVVTVLCSMPFAWLFTRFDVELENRRARTRSGVQ
jgi:rod shape-determining protein MreD